MRGLLLLLILSVICPEAAMGSPLSPADLQRPPSPELIEKLTQLPPAQAADEITGALFQSYRPARSGLRGSSAQPAYQQWVNLAAWFDLLSQSEQDHVDQLLKRRLLITGEDQITLIATGVNVPPDARPLDDARRESFLQGLGDTHGPWNSIFPTGYTFEDQILEKRISPELKQFFAIRPAALKELLDNLSERDFYPAVLDQLQAMHAAAPEDFETYLSLAIALAVVYDEPLPSQWPHHQVDRASVPIDTRSTAERFAFWVAAAKAKRLYHDPTTLGADQLKFVIDAPLVPSEFEWAWKEAKFPRSDFGKAFSSIRYDRPRLETGRFSWPSELPYTLAAIKDAGGICVDQAYFAMVAGKAFGLPTLYFVGQGADGGHAWFGYMKGNDRWDMDVGRYENQNYATGQALDPQTWETVTDHELDFLARRFRKTPEFAAGLTDLRVAALARQRNERAGARTGFESATVACPQNHEAWLQLGEFLREENDPAALAAFYESASKNFSGQRQLQAIFLQEAIKAWKEIGQPEKATALEDQMIAANRTGRADLSVGLVSARLRDLITAGQFDEAYEYYRVELTKLSRRGGGDVFYDMVYPLTKALAAAGDMRGAKRAFDLGRRQLNPSRGSVLDQQFTKLAEETEL